MANTQISSAYSDDGFREYIADAYIAGSHGIEFEFERLKHGFDAMRQ